MTAMSRLSSCGLGGGLTPCLEARLFTMIPDTTPANMRAGPTDHVRDSSVAVGMKDSGVPQRIDVVKADVESIRPPEEG